MTPQETADKYGVPTPETCIKLDWELTTNFYWHKQNAEWQLSYGKPEIFAIDDPFGEILVIPAPQIHEIAKFIPMELLNYKSHDRVIFCQYKNTISYSLINNYFATEIVNNNLANAYSELYLKLKKENLLLQC